MEPTTGPTADARRWIGARGLAAAAPLVGDPAQWQIGVGVTPPGPPPMLFARVARGDATAVQACMNRFGGLVWSLARRHSASAADAEDAVQEIFLDLWRSAAAFDPDRGSEAVFVTVIARRRLIDRARARKRRIESLPMTPDVLQQVKDERASPEDAAELSSAEKALAQLRPAEREAVLMATCDGLSHSEIARKTGTALGTVKSNVRRGLMRLRALIAGEAGPAPHDDTIAAAPPVVAPREEAPGERSA